MDIKFNEGVLLEAVTENETSKAFMVDQFKRVGLQFVAADITSGNGVFRVQGTIDGQNWVDLNMMVDNVTNTNGQDLTRIGSKTLSADGTSLVWLLDTTLKAIRVGVNTTTDGTYSCYAIANG